MHFPLEVPFQECDLLTPPPVLTCILLLTFPGGASQDGPLFWTSVRRNTQQHHTVHGAVWPSPAVPSGLQKAAEGIFFHEGGPNNGKDRGVLRPVVADFRSAGGPHPLRHKDRHFHVGA